ncbi:MAG: hypothetical protein IH602_20100 [Bryobacteraceae bacterium]|nr:hypothetical protein [Bryobacteraceae bacterium]
MGFANTDTRKAACWVSLAISFVLMAVGALIISVGESRTLGFSLLVTGLVMMNVGAIGLTCSKD